MRLTQSSTCGVNRSQSCNGKSVSVVASALMRASFQVCMARSDAFNRLLFGSTSCISHSFSERNFLIYFVAWLSITFNLTL